MDSNLQLFKNEAYYRSIPIHESGEPLISLSNISPKIKIFPFYFQQNLPNTLNECYLREGAAQRLMKAAEKLPDGLNFVVLDGWRPYKVQKVLYEMTIDAFKKDGMAESEIYREIPKFVSYPSDNIDTPSPHMTGGSVDLTIADQDGWLDMGTGFDEFTDKAKTTWYEEAANLSETEHKIRNNRRLLKQVMTDVGFENFEEEWWHYDYGNQRWAMLTHQLAIYKGLR
ncbi:MAG: M15 family metallopeptidase [Paenibacillaceae bacterium]